MASYRAFLLCLTALFFTNSVAYTEAPNLRVGAAFHAFEHLGGFGKQAEAAAACGVTIIYATGLGGDGYTGLPPAAEWDAHLKDCAEYTKHAKSLGIKSVLGYLCATSIVGLGNFAKNWTDGQRTEFRTLPDTWLQQDIEGKPLESWYGGEYNPACMNNPDWRAYEHYMVRSQVQTGHDGIFFDNPTVHQKGCYCPHCMKCFAVFLRGEGASVGDDSLTAMRKLAAESVSDFKRYRCTIARDFIEDMRTYARSLNPDAVVTVNNSLNTPGVFYSQSQLYAYNIYEMSKAEDFVVVEDMATQPRTLPDGKVIEYGPTYKQLHAIIHDKPLVAVTIAEGDYHTPPNLVQLAMIEGAAHGASYMLWSTWPEEQRAKMIAAIRPCADWLAVHSDLLNDMSPRQDVMVFLPFRNWVNTEECAVSALVAQLTRENIQYGVFSEGEFERTLAAKPKVAILESRDVLIPMEAEALAAYETSGGIVVTAESNQWLKSVQKLLAYPSIRIRGTESVRGVVGELQGKVALLIYNLNVRRISSFEDQVTPAENLKVSLQIPFREIDSVKISNPENGGTSKQLEYSLSIKGEDTFILFEIARLNIGALVTISKKDQG